MLCAARFSWPTRAPAPLAQRQSNGLLIHRFWVRIPGGARKTRSNEASYALSCRVGRFAKPFRRPGRCECSPSTRPPPPGLRPDDSPRGGDLWHHDRSRRVPLRAPRRPPDADASRVHDLQDAYGSASRSRPPQPSTPRSSPSGSSRRPSFSTLASNPQIGAAVQALGNALVTVDVATHKDGRVRVVEVGHGQVSDRPREPRSRDVARSAPGLRLDHVGTTAQRREPCGLGSRSGPGRAGSRKGLPPSRRESAPHPLHRRNRETLMGAYVGKDRSDGSRRQGTVRVRRCGQRTRGGDIRRAFRSIRERMQWRSVAAWQLYTWNAAASSAFYGPLQAVERFADVLRNLIICEWSGGTCR